MFRLMFSLFVFIKVVKCALWSTLEKDGINYTVRRTSEYIIEKLPNDTLGETSITSIEELETLIIQNTDLVEIAPGAFHNLPNLKKLQLVSNARLREINEGVLNNLNLTQLELSYGSFSINVHALDNMPALELIILYSINLKTWQSDWFKNTPSLHQIFVHFNPLEELPAGAFRNLNPERLHSISMYRNKIKTVDGAAFQGLRKIDNLSLAQNELVGWNATVLSGIQVGSLRLRGNRIKYLDVADFEGIFAANFTDISGNLFDGELLGKIREFVRKSGKRVKFE